MEAGKGFGPLTNPTHQGMFMFFLLFVNFHFLILNTHDSYLAALL